MGGGILLEDATVEQLIEALTKKGYSGYVGEATEASTTFVIVRFEEVLTNDHSYDAHIRVKESFVRTDAYDWERSPAGHSCDAMMSIVVGKGEVDQYVNPDQPECVIVRHYETGRKYKESTHDPTPPVWAFAFTAEELKQLQEKVVSSGMTLFHREPSGPALPDAKWYQESHWLIEDGAIAGIKLIVKPTQDPEPTVKICRFKARGDQFDLVGAETVSQPTFDFTTTCTVPTEVIRNVPEVKQPTEVPDVNRDYKAEGEMPLEMVVKSDPNKYSLQSLYHAVTNNEWQGKLFQHMCTPAITLTNQSDKEINVKEVCVEFKNAEGAWVKCEQACMGFVDSWGGGGISWEESAQHFNLDAKQTETLAFRGSTNIPLGNYKGYEGNYMYRAHHAWPTPLVYRLILLGADGTSKSMEFEYANEPLEHPWNTYEDAIAVEQAEGIGADFVCDLWLCVENPLTLCKDMVCVTSSKTDANQWYIRVVSDRRNLGAGYSCVDPEYFRKMAYTAAKEGKSEIMLDFINNKECSLYALVDTEKKVAYGLKAEVKVEHGGETILHATSYGTLDYKRVVQKSA